MNVNALGGKTSLGTSTVNRREVRKLKVLAGRVKQIGTISADASAALYRKALVHYNPKLIGLFQGLQLSF